MIAILAALAFPAWRGAKERANRTSMVSLLRTTGVAINLYTTDHSGILPGPLWPGQVAEYSPEESGRLVVVLAPYLGLKEDDSPRVVEKFLPSWIPASLPSIPPSEIRVLVMNTAVSTAGGGTSSPWGSLTPSVSPPARAAQFSGSTNWALSEAYQGHPSVANRPWKMSTPPLPVSGKKPLGLFFDGRVGEFTP